MSRELEIVDELRALFNRWTVALEHYGLLVEMEHLLKRLILWPPKTVAAAEEVFGGSIHNPKGKTHGALDRRIQHALRVWAAQHGGTLNDAQLDAADTALAYAIRKHASAEVPHALLTSVRSPLLGIAVDDRVTAALRARSSLTDASALIAAGLADEPASV